MGGGLGFAFAGRRKASVPTRASFLHDPLSRHDVSLAVQNSFLDGAKVFALGLYGSGNGGWKMGRVRANHWQVLELQALRNCLAAWPAGCLFSWQVERRTIL